MISPSQRRNSAKFSAFPPLPLDLIHRLLSPARDATLHPARGRTSSPIPGERQIGRRGRSPERVGKPSGFGSPPRSAASLGDAYATGRLQMACAGGANLGGPPPGKGSASLRTSPDSLEIYEMSSVNLRMNTLDEYRIKLTVRNNLLLSAIEAAGYKTQAEFARANGIRATDLNALVGLREPPIKANGEFSPLARSVM